MPDHQVRLDPAQGETAADLSSGDGKTSANGKAQPAPSVPHPRHDGSAPGPLVLIGGATDPQGDALGCFLHLAGARQGGKIVGITTASANPLHSAQEWTEVFAQAGADNVEIPVIDRRDRAQDRAIAALLRSADGILLGGGDQVQLVSTLGGSRVGRALREAHAAGVVVCGTSAGAAALTETILAGGEPDEYGQMHEMYIGPGFGMLGFRAVIDTHFAQRRRLQRLFMVVAQNPELMGLGIDEDTALVVQGHLGKVVGRGSVTFVDGRGVRFDNAEECMRGEAPLTLSYLRVGIIGARYSFNLQERELENLVRARAHEEETPVVRGERAEEFAARPVAGG